MRSEGGGVCQNSSRHKYGDIFSNTCHDTNGSCVMSLNKNEVPRLKS